MLETSSGDIRCERMARKTEGGILARTDRWPTSKVSGSQPATFTNGERPEPSRRGRFSPIAELLIDPDSAPRCAIRDSRRSGAERYLWTLTVFGYHQLTAGRTGDLEEARSRAEAALESYAALRSDGGGCPDDW